MRIEALRRVVLGALAIASLVAAPASADTLTVTSGADSGDGSLREAVADAQPAGDTIAISPGVPEVSLTSPIKVDKSLTIRGQGMGATEVAMTGIPASRIFEVGTITPGISVRIENLTVSGGRAPAGTAGQFEGGSGPGSPPTPGGPGGDGGAILNQANQLTLGAVLLRDNAAGPGGVGGGGSGPFPTQPGGAGGSGGAIANSGGLSLSGSVFAGNEAGLGGMPGFNFTLFISAPAGPAGGGGAILNTGTLTVVDSTFAGNEAAPGRNGESSAFSSSSGSEGGDGGAITSSGTLTVLSSTFSANRAGSGGSGGGGAAAAPAGSGGRGGDGGALFVAGGLASITNSTLHANRAGNGGPGGEGSIIAGNGGEGGAGGAIAGAAGSEVVLAASTLATNRAGAGGPGGAGAPPTGTPGSSGANGTGGGMSSGGNFTIRGSILAANVDDNCAGPVLDGGGNLAAPEAGGCIGFAVADPRLGPLADNGGPTQTMALMPGSAAIGAVPAAACLTATGDPNPVDQRGVARSPAACDAGAFQVPPAEPSPAPPHPTSTKAPTVRFLEKPKKKVKTAKRRARVRFAFAADVAAASFECRLDRQRFKPCRSPQVLRLRPGRHSFAVRASAAGLTGAAATHSFKVQRVAKKPKTKRGR